MAKNGQAKVLSNDEFATVLDEIEHHRYPAKNALIIQISFKLGLRAQEMALLRIRQIAALSDEDHMATILREWSGIDRASSHSGRRTLASILLHDQGEHLKTVQKVLGHKSAATTTIYQDVTEQEVRDVLKKAGKNYDS